jgi:hypothetical protein
MSFVLLPAFKVSVHLFGSAQWDGSDEDEFVEFVS